MKKRSITLLVLLVIVSVFAICSGTATWLVNQDVERMKASMTETQWRDMLNDKGLPQGPILFIAGASTVVCSIASLSLLLGYALYSRKTI